MSPEMLDELGHGFSMDIYSLGALLFEFLTGLPPHYSQDREELFFNICNEELEIPNFLSAEAQDLLANLLKKDPFERLGAINGISEIKTHPFCACIDFDALYEKRYNPPFIPDPNESYFDMEYLETQIKENPENYFPIKDIMKPKENPVSLRNPIKSLNYSPEIEKQAGSK